MKRAPLITADDKADIARLLPEHGVAYVAEWLGCHRSTIIWHAKRLGIAEWPSPTGPGYRKPSLSQRDVPGVSKVCLGCGESKALSEYHQHKVGRFGKRPRCKTCDVRPSRARRPVTIRQELPA